MKKIYIITGFCLMLLFSCTSSFEDLNSNSTQPTDNEASQDWIILGGNFQPMQRGIMEWTHWKYQLQQNLNGDAYSQYLISPTPFGGNINNINYGFNEGWNLWPWKIGFEEIMLPASAVKIQTQGKSNLNHFAAWAKILKVFGMHRVSDIYGPLVYSKYRTVDINTPYDSQQDVYNQFFVELKEAVDMLTPFAVANNPSFKAFDLTYGGDMKKWIQAANSLRVRLAMRISLVDPARAKAEYQAAIGHQFGLISNNSLNMVVALPESHPDNTISNDWGDTRMSATMESYLKGFNDPRMKMFFAVDATKKEYHGIRQGININSKSDYEKFTSPVGAWAVAPKAVIITYSEICFLRAEASLRGWDTGDAKTYYENGVKASFDQWGAAGVDSYLADGAKTPTAYTDPIGKTVNNLDQSAMPSTTVLWNDALTNEQKLEKIITQKWIALFPDGQEAWSEFRRTGYPSLFPLVVNNCPTLKGKFVKRLKFSRDEYDRNAGEVAKATQLLGVKVDDYNTRLWWDVNDDAPGNNFPN
jgi:hypothetical protein